MSKTTNTKTTKTEKGLSTKELLDIALDLAGVDECPPDSGVIVEGNNIKKVLFGVDMDTPELLLARELGYDCVVSHHPRVTNTKMLTILENANINKLFKLGVPKNRTQKLVQARANELSYWEHVSNSRRSESAAKLLGMPFISLHNPADLIGENTVQEFLDKKFEGNENVTLGDITSALEELPEYKNSERKPIIRVGSKDSFAGKIVVQMAGLTGPGANVLKEYFRAGVGTLVMMHIPEADTKALKEQNIGNVIIAGHTSSDSIGINKIIREWEKRGVETTAISGIVSDIMPKESK
ncbi:MAG: Nif3-like dinuclear metal center hexameric protein [Firmicutes bacterium]|nr:Nif3-like dinuclear metal center hexameric protein [Bacillota bacterium]